MDCTNARHLLIWRTAHGTDLAAAERDDLEGHLAGCPMCRAAADDEARLDAHLGRAMRDVPVPGGLRERLLAAVAPAPVKPPVRWRRRVGYGVGLAAAASVGLLVWGLYFGRGPLRRPIAPGDVQMAYIATAARDVETVNEELHLLGARRSAPHFVNYAYLTGAPSLAVLPGYRGEKVKVPQLIFSRGRDKAIVYVLSNRLYKLEDFHPHGTYEYNLEVVRPERGNFSYLILYTGRDWDWLKKVEADT